MLLHVESQAGRELMADAAPASDSAEATVALLNVATSGDQLEEQEAQRLLRSVAQPQDVLNRVSMTHSLYKGRVAGDLGVPAIGFSGNAEADSLTVVQDTYRAVRQARGQVAVYRGGSVRIAVTAFGLSADAKLSLPMIAASAELGQTRAYYRFDVIGIKDFSDVADNLPTLGSFDIQAYASLLTAANKCTQLLLTADLQPDDLFVEPLSADVPGMTHTLINALRQVAAGNDPRIVDVTPDRDDFHDWIIQLVQREAQDSGNPREWARSILNQQADKLRDSF